MSKLIYTLLFLALAANFPQALPAQDAFIYDDITSSMVPIPPAEQNLQSREARFFKQAADNGQTLEGALYGANGDLFFCNVSDSEIMRLTPDGDLAVIAKIEDFSPGGLAWGKDGRLFAAGINQARRNGGITAIDSAGTQETIIPVDAGFMPNDLVFAPGGGFYFTDFRGSATNPQGGVYYVSPDYKQITPVIANMAQANGVALSPDAKTLWATEYGRNLLHRVNLDSETTVPLTGSKILYHFTGPAPDSMRVDADGNVYVALVGQGRVLIFNPAGIPIGQVLLPNRDQGFNLRSTSLALHPDKAEMAIVSGNTREAPARAANIFIAPSFAPAQPGIN